MLLRVIKLPSWLNSETHSFISITYLASAYWKHNKTDPALGRTNKTEPFPSVFLRGTLCSHPSPTDPPLQEYSAFPASLLLFPFLTSISGFLTNHWQEFPPTQSRSKDRRLLGSAGLMKAIQLPLKATGWTQCLEWMRNLMKICGMKERINETHWALKKEIHTISAIRVVACLRRQKTLIEWLKNTFRTIFFPTNMN